MRLSRPSETCTYHALPVLTFAVQSMEHGELREQGRPATRARGESDMYRYVWQVLIRVLVYVYVHVYVQY